MEQVDLAVPVGSYRVTMLILVWAPEPTIRVKLHSLDGTAVLEHVYTGATAQTMMIALNKANLSTVSLHRRILQQLVADGIIGGVVTGAPD